MQPASHKPPSMISGGTNGRMPESQHLLPGLPRTYARQQCFPARQAFIHSASSTTMLNLGVLRFLRTTGAVLLALIMGLAFSVGAASWLNSSRAGPVRRMVCLAPGVL